MRIYLSLFVLSLCFLACNEEEALTAVSPAAPTALDLQFVVATDNSGQVEITPGGQGATLFALDFGDGSAPATDLEPGESVTHVYSEGTFMVGLTGTGLDGVTTSYSEELMMSFAAPENLIVTVTPTPGNPLGVDVTATADLETDFAVFFGESADEEAVTFTEGETVSYTYGQVGTYIIRVVARSGGTATVEESVEVSIANPLLLPVDFEDADRDYGLQGFGGSEVALIDNPDRSGENTTGRVASLTKTSGSEVWAGSVFELGEPLDLSTEKQINVLTWSPRAGVPILFKIENSTDPNVFVEVTQNTTVANAWEMMSFNLSGAAVGTDYSKIVVFYDFGTAGMGETFYFDELVQTDGRGTIGLPLTFEEGNIEFSFSGFGGGEADVVDNPDNSAGNPSARVGRFAKNPNSEVWGGVFIDASAPLDFSGGQRVRMKVWSPTAGAGILLKLENPTNSDIFQEVQVNTTTSDAWEELAFDFSGIQNLAGIQRIVLFCNFGVSGTDGNYYFDDIRIE